MVFASETPIAPQISTLKPKNPASNQLCPQLIIRKYRQPDAVINAPYFSCHLSNFEGFLLTKNPSLLLSAIAQNTPFLKYLIYILYYHYTKITIEILFEKISITP